MLYFLHILIILIAVSVGILLTKLVLFLWGKFGSKLGIDKSIMILLVVIIWLVAAFHIFSAISVIFTAITLPKDMPPVVPSPFIRIP